MKPVVFKVLRAKKRFAVGLKIDGKLYEQSTWEAESSRQPILALIEGCGLKEDSQSQVP